MDFLRTAVAMWSMVMRMAGCLVAHKPSLSETRVRCVFSDTVDASDYAFSDQTVVYQSLTFDPLDEQVLVVKEDSAEWLEGVGLEAPLQVGG